MSGEEYHIVCKYHFIYSLCLNKVNEQAEGVKLEKQTPGTPGELTERRSNGSSSFSFFCARVVDFFLSVMFQIRLCLLAVALD